MGKDKPAEAQEIVSSQEVASSHIVSSQEAQEAGAAASGLLGAPSGGGPPGPPSSGVRKVQWVDATNMTVVRLYGDGRKEVAPLQLGPGAFATVVFAGEGPETTEVPNLTLLAAQQSSGAAGGKVQAKLLLSPRARARARALSKRKGKAKCKGGAQAKGKAKGKGQAKGKAEAADQQDEEEEEEEEAPAPSPAGAQEEAPAPGPLQRSYRKMWYAAAHGWGVRQRFLGQRQVFLVGGKKCGLGKEELAAVADAAIERRTAEGLPEGAAKEWAQTRVRYLAKRG
jgi:hypothetical protein